MLSGLVLVRPLFQTSRQPLSHYVLIWPVLCALMERERDLASLPLLRRTPILLDEDPTLITSFNLNFLPKGPVSKYSHIRH